MIEVLSSSRGGGGMAFLHFAWVGGNSGVQVLSGSFLSCSPSSIDRLYLLMTMISSVTKWFEISAKIGPLLTTWLWVLEVYVC
jgi:hypothetical protein